MKIVFGGHHLLLHHSGVLFWPAQSMLIVSDLHLEKGSHFAQRGYFLPPYDSSETLQRLLAVCATLGPKRVLLLGDSFHDAKGYERLSGGNKALFHELLHFDPVWITGNHDADFVPQGFQTHDEFILDGLTFRHEAGQDECFEVSGHYHPKAEIVHKGARISARCFIEDGQRLIMPSFGAYTGGLSVNDPVISRLFSAPITTHLLGQNKVYSLKSR